MITERLMRAFMIVEVEVFFDPFVELNTVFKDMQVNAFILERAPKTFYKYIIDCTTNTIHAYCNWRLTFEQQAGVFVAGELTSLVGVDDLGLPMHQDSFFNNGPAPLGTHRVA